MTLQFLKDTALQWCNGYDKTQWIVTVPAIWSDSAKGMMRNASDKVCFDIDIKILMRNIWVENVLKFDKLDYP